MFRFMFAVLMLSQVASAQGLAIGFVDVQRVIFEYKKTTDITTTLEKRIRQERTLVAQRKEALRTRMEALDDLRHLRLGDRRPRRVRVEQAVEHRDQGTGFGADHEVGIADAPREASTARLAKE